MAEHGEAIEADLLETYGVDLLDIGTPRLSWRRLWSLLAHLPRDSRYARATTGEQASWGYTEHLLATLIDIAQIGNWLFVSANSKDRVEQPKPLPRPGDTVRTPRRHGYTPDQTRRLLDEWRAGRLSVVETKAQEVT